MIEKLAIILLLLTRAKDCSQWRLEASGQFSNKSTFLKLTKGATKVSLLLVNLIWKTKFLENEFFLWSLPSPIEVSTPRKAPKEVS